MAKNLDRELAEAAGLDRPEAEEAAENMAVPQPPEPRGAPAADGSKSKKNLGLLVMLLLMVTGIVCLFWFTQEVQVYAMKVEAFVPRAQEFVDRPVRLEGELTPGSLLKREEPCEYRFRMRSGEKEVTVRFPQCVVPESFRDVPEGGVLLTVEGKYRAGEGGYLEAWNIMAKCASKYDKETHTMGGEKQALAE
jgi:cytochrome c-type biogenesis protein CcmE